MSAEHVKRAEAARRHLELALAYLDDLGWHQAAAMVDHALHLINEGRRREAEQTSAG